MPNADSPVIALPKRLAALHALHLLDSGPEPAFDRLTNLAATVTKSPIALLALVDDSREYFKSAVGLKEPFASRRSVPLTHSFAQHVVSTGQPLIIEDARFHKLGEGNEAVHELGMIAYLGLPLTLPSGQTIGAFSLADNKPRMWSPQDNMVAREMTTSAITEIELRQAHSGIIRAWHLVDIAENTTDLVWIADADYNFTTMNAAARRFFGIAEGKVNGTPVGSHLKGESYHFLRGEAVRAAVDSGAWSGELYFTRHDGHHVPMSVVILAHRAEDGELDYWSVVARDTTAWHEAQNAVQQALEQEQRTTRLQGRFINTISHEFRGPLTAVLSSLELLIRHGSRTDPSAQYERMKKSLRDISSVLDRGIRLLHDTEDETPPHITEISVETFAREVIESASAGFEGRVIQSEIPPNPTVVSVDVAALRTVAEHLLINALKFSTVGAQVILKFALRDCDETNKHCQLVMYVRDQGIGIPEDDQPFVFERFYRAYNLPNVPGIGAGLYHVRRLIERMQGKIEFFSRVGEGTEFVIMVPVENLSPKPKTSSRKASSSAAQSPSA